MSNPSNNNNNNNNNNNHNVKMMEVKQEEQQGPPSTIKSYQDGQKQQLQSSNYASACQWAAQQSPHMVPQITSSPPPKEPIRPKGEKIGADEIQVVQNHIEKCLQLYMNQNEVITALVSQANIEPGFTSLVWQKLEEQNPEFFRGYHVRLRVKEQITAFNYLATQQYQALQKANPNYFQLPATTTVPGSFSFRADGQPPQSQSQPNSSTTTTTPPQSSTNTTNTTTTSTAPSNSQSQQPRSPQPPQPAQNQSTQKSQTQTQATKQSQQSSQQTQQKQGNLKKDEFIDTNIFFEQPS